MPRLPRLQTVVWLLPLLVVASNLGAKGLEHYGWAAQRSEFLAAEQALQQLEYTRIRAPYKGIVTERLVEVGESVQPGQPLISGLSLEQMRISVDVPQNLVESIRKERQAQVEVGGRWVLAESVTVFPVADPRSDTFEVRLQLPAAVEDVFPGMYVKVGFVAGSQPALVVPLAAVVFWIHPEQSATQIGISTTAILTLIAYRFMVAADLPEIPYLTRMDIFILGGTLVVFLILVVAVATVYLASSGRLGLALTIERHCRWAFPAAFADESLADTTHWMSWGFTPYSCCMKPRIQVSEVEE